VGLLLGGAAAGIGVALAPGDLWRRGDWSRVGFVISIAAACAIWELLLHLRTRPRKSARPAAPSPTATGVVTEIAFLAGLALAVALASGWLEP
jgi:hypothetical protein